VIEPAALTAHLDETGSVLPGGRLMYGVVAVLTAEADRKVWLYVVVRLERRYRCRAVNHRASGGRVGVRVRGGSDLGSISQSVEYTGLITCGHNPSLVARQATATVDATGQLSLVDDPLPSTRNATEETWEARRWTG
jgi:hypothetical protein